MWAQVLFIGFVFGIMGTTIGGIIGIFLKVNNPKLLSFIIEFAAGLMMAVVSLDLLPESFEYGGLTFPVIFFTIGIIVTILIEGIIDKFFRRTKKYINMYGEKGISLKKVGILIGISLALHNLPEGIAIGSGFSSSYKLRIITCISNCHTRYT